MKNKITTANDLIESCEGLQRGDEELMLQANNNLKGCINK